jgi:drug/metabolite transporter (DMT)-like permease
MRKLRPHQAAGILISLLGLVVIAGWWTGQRRLVHLTPEYFPMAFNVALCFFLAGVALVVPESQADIRKKAHQAAGVLIVGLAVVTGKTCSTPILASTNCSPPNGWITATPTRGAWRR